MTDELPEGTTFASMEQGTASESANVSGEQTATGVKWTINGLAGGETVTLKFRVTAPSTVIGDADSRVFINQASMEDTELALLMSDKAVYNPDGSVKYREGESVYTEEEITKLSEITYHQINRSDLSAAKAADPATPGANGGATVIKAGDTITYTVTVNNDGIADAYNVYVRDSIPDGTTFVPGSIAYTLASGQTYPVADGASGTWRSTTRICRRILKIPIPRRPPTR